MQDPTLEEFHRLFESLAPKFGCDYRKEVVDYLVRTHYHPSNRPLRRCHPRDLLSQIRNYCVYNDLPMEMEQDHFDRVVCSYFTALSGQDVPPIACVQTEMCDR